MASYNTRLTLLNAKQRNCGTA